MRRRISQVLVAVSLSFVVAFSGQFVLANGYWNVPGTHWQRSGHGFGAGYHAPLVLGPITFDSWHWPNHVRLSCAPNPTCGYACGYGCDQSIESPSMIEGVVPIPAAPTPTPAPAASEAVFGTPVAVAPNAAVSNPAQPQGLFIAPIQP